MSFEDQVTFRVTFCVDRGTLTVLDEYVAGHFDMSRSDAIRQAIRLMLKIESGQQTRAPLPPRERV